MVLDIPKGFPCLWEQESPLAILLKMGVWGCPISERSWEQGSLLSNTLRIICRQGLPMIVLLRDFLVSPLVQSPPFALVFVRFTYESNYVHASVSAAPLSNVSLVEVKWCGYSI